MKNAFSQVPVPKSTFPGLAESLENDVFQKNFVGLWEFRAQQDYGFERGSELRGPAAILFISRDTFTDSIAKLSRACFKFLGYRTSIARYVGVSQKKAPRGGVSHPVAKVSRDRGYLRELEKAVAVSGFCSGVLEENSGKVPGKLLENFSRIAKCYKF